ncbi:MAG: hypothetical protein HPY61_01670 [Methanotrichaceae archaeon]|nr:hypothetical protein [Methanotrichaceae archaeon]
MVERDVSIRLNVVGGQAASDLLSRIISQRAELASKSKIGLNIDSRGLEQAQKSASMARLAIADASKDMSRLGKSITANTVGPLTAYTTALGAAMQAGRALGPGLVAGLRAASAEFARQKTLAQFWGTSGYLNAGVQALKSGLSSFLAGGGQGFTRWLQDVSAHLSNYRAGMVAAGASMLAVASAAAMNSGSSKRLIQETLDSALMSRKLTDKEGARTWIESAQQDDFSQGRESRLKIFQSILSKNRYMGQEGAQKATENLEKYFFARSEQMKAANIGSVEELGDILSREGQLSGDEARKVDDILGLGTSVMSPQARLSRMSAEAAGIDMKQAMAERPEQVLSTRLSKGIVDMGDTVYPTLLKVLNLFVKLSDAISRVPGLPQALGWGAVLAGAGAAGLTLLSVVGSLIPGLQVMLNLVKLDTIARAAHTAITYAQAAATGIATAGQWALNAAMSANPIGLLIVGAAALIAILYALEKRFGLVSKAWQMFSNSPGGHALFASIEAGKRALDGLKKTLTGAWASGGAGGVLKVAVAAMTNANPGLKIMLLLVDFVRRVWTNTGIMSKTISAGLVLWQRITDTLGWLVNAISNTVRWLKDGLGISKQQAKQQMESQAKKENLEWRDADTKHGVVAGWYQVGTDSSKGPAEASSLLQRYAKEYQNAPGGIFEAIPGMDRLVEAMDQLRNTISGLASTLAEAKEKAQVQAQTTGAQVAQKLTAAGIPAVNVDRSAQKTYFLPDGRSWTDEEFGALSPYERNQLIGQGLTRDAFREAPAMSRGGSIIGSGALVGHQGEEVSPAQVVSGGKTTLARINEIFSGEVRSAGGQTINLNPEVNLNVRIDKVSSDVDIDHLISRIGNEGADKLLFILRSKLDNMSSRGIGYMRG